PSTSCRMTFGHCGFWSPCRTHNATSSRVGRRRSASKSSMPPTARSFPMTRRSEGRTMTDATGALKPRLRGAHVLAIIVCFFATIFVVDGFMIYRAVTTFGGVETPDAYRKGVVYNASIASEARQAQLGWTDEIKVAGAPPHLRVNLRNKEGSAVG